MAAKRWWWPWRTRAGNDETTVRTVRVGDLDANRDAFAPNVVCNSKYTVWTFIPLSLWEQFSRAMNLYFLLIAVMQLWAEITPVNPITTWAPLIVILSVSALKEGIDDYTRHKRDDEANSAEFDVIRKGVRETVRAMDLCVGDVLYLRRNDEVPADCVLLVSSNHDGTAHVQTSNLDGECDYKLRVVSAEVHDALDEDSVHRFDGVIECLPPEPSICIGSARTHMNPSPPPPLTPSSPPPDKFDGNVQLSHSRPSKHALSVENTLWQGCHLRNVDYVYCAVVYTGEESRMGLNKHATFIKWTHLDNRIDTTVRAIFLMQLVLVAIVGCAGDVWKSAEGEHYWYLAYGHHVWWHWIIIPARFLLLFSLMIPISLKVTLDCARFFYALLIQWDVELYDPVNDIAAVVNNTNVAEDMGQVEFVMCDKTGTLTENIMVLRKCSIAGQMFGESEQVSDMRRDPALLAAMERGDEHAVQFFTVLAVCNTVVPVDRSGGAGMPHIEYEASSPDEEALVKAAAEFGVTLIHRDREEVHIRVRDTLVRYTVLDVLEFTSERKRMSVVVQDINTGKRYVFTKGADDVVFAALAHSATEPATTDGHVMHFASLGLRTLCIAQREVAAAEYAEWKVALDAARTSVARREEAVASACEVMERGLCLLGATAIEDKLQQGVPDTIQILRDAGVSVWMLTGDKFETAVQISRACKMVAAGDGTLAHIDGETAVEVANAMDMAWLELEVQKKAGCDMAIIIDGTALEVALEHLPDALSDLALQCSSVVCCRCSPTQKARVVKLVQSTGGRVLAVGDGGNDVSMLQEAHVGVGIVGKEGLQAARAADVSVSNFRFLRRLMLVHGRYAYTRTATIAQYSFSKSIFICFLQLSFAFASATSGASLFNTISLTTWNLPFTGLPIAFFVLDKDISEDTVFAHPAVYATGLRNLAYNARTLFAWGARSVLQAVLVFILVEMSLSTHVGTDGDPVDGEVVSMTVYTAAVLIQTLNVALEHNTITWLNAAVLGAMPVLYFAVMSVASTLPALSMYGVMEQMYTDPACILTLLLVIVAAMVPLLAAKYVKAQYYPSFSQVLRSEEHENHLVKLSFDPFHRDVVYSPMLAPKTISVVARDSDASVGTPTAHTMPPLDDSDSDGSGDDAVSAALLGVRTPPRAAVQRSPKHMPLPSLSSVPSLELSESPHLSPVAMVPQSPPASFFPRSASPGRTLGMPPPAPAPGSPSTNTRLLRVGRGAVRKKSM